MIAPFWVIKFSKPRLFRKINYYPDKNKYKYNSKN